MLWQEERQFLYWIGRQSNGLPIVDLGTFLGASAACMAAGAEDAGSASRVTSYDLFTYGSWCAPFEMGDGWENGADTRPFVQSLLAPWGNRVDLVKGDISAQHWDGGEIDTLFVDFTQNWNQHHHVCSAFLPYLRLGGVLAHQDYVHVLCYWLHIFMECYARHFELISQHIESCTAAWRYVDPLPPEAFEKGLNETLTFKQMLEFLERSIDKYDEPWRGLLMIARARFFLHARGPDAARHELSALEVKYGDVREIRPHLDGLSAEIPRWPQHGGAYAGYFIDD